jgi:hypothetical protein
MYAASANSKIYHLTELPEEKTLCGVKFMPIVMEQPRAAGLSLLRTQPEGYSLCRHCDRVRAHENELEFRSLAY